MYSSFEYYDESQENAVTYAGNYVPGFAPAWETGNSVVDYIGNSFASAANMFFYNPLGAFSNATGLTDGVISVSDTLDYNGPTIDGYAIAAQWIPYFAVAGVAARGVTTSNRAARAVINAGISLPKNRQHYVSHRAAMLAAKRDAGIPTSQTHSSHYKTKEDSLDKDRTGTVFDFSKKYQPSFTI